MKVTYYVASSLDGCIAKEPKGALASAYEVLRNYGNMSSASILFVLEDMLRNTRLETGYALMSALGPGFSSDQLLLKIS